MIQISKSSPNARWIQWNYLLICFPTPIDSTFVTHPQNHSPLSEPQGRASPSQQPTQRVPSAADRLASTGFKVPCMRKASEALRTGGARRLARARSERPRIRGRAARAPLARRFSGPGQTWDREFCFTNMRLLPLLGVLLLALRTSAAKQKPRRRSAWNRHFPRYRRSWRKNA